MRSITLVPHLTEEEITKKRDRTSNKRQYQRWQVIWLAHHQWFRAEEIAQTVGVKVTTVYYWVFQYNHQGPEGYLLRKRGGAHRRLLTDAQEKEILQSLSEPAARGEVVVAQAVRTAVEATLGRTVGRDFPFRMLHRHQWRKVSPRPEHPEKDPEAQETFKKNFRN